MDFISIESSITIHENSFVTRTMKGKRVLSFIVSLFSLISNGESASRIDPLVDTKVGLIRGVQASDGEYSMFMGIPYAYINESNPFGVCTFLRT